MTDSAPQVLYKCTHIIQSVLLHVPDRFIDSHNNNTCVTFLLKPLLIAHRFCFFHYRCSMQQVSVLRNRELLPCAVGSLEQMEEGRYFHITMGNLVSILSSFAWAYLFDYHDKPKYWDRLAWANSVDPDQKSQNVGYDQGPRPHCLQLIQQIFDT